MSKKYTGKQIIKAGERLLDDNIEDFESAMDILSYWRFSHEIPLGGALKILQETTLKIDKSAIFAKRLKRYASIVFKLRRFKKMKLKNMQDIGGCRAIVSNPKKLKKVVRELRRRPEFKNSEGNIRFKDYIEKPKEDGYRGYHLIGQFKDEYGEKKDIEVQLRTNLQHDWATALEIVDLFTGQALKSNQGHEDWKKFFSSVSEQFAVMENIHLFNTFDDIKKFKEYMALMKKNQHLIESCLYTQKYADKLDVVSKFNAFTQSLKIVDGKLEKNSVDGYVLVEVDTLKSTVKTTFFKQEDNKNAEKMYIEAEKLSAEKSHIVVALVSTTAVGGIKEAYPNYFADSTEFLKYLLFVTKVK
jgi:hypothetical protein